MGQGLPFEVFWQLLEIIYFSIFTVLQFQFIFFPFIGEITELICKTINAPVGLYKLPLGSKLLN